MGTRRSFVSQEMAKSVQPSGTVILHQQIGLVEGVCAGKDAEEKALLNPTDTILPLPLQLCRLLQVVSRDRLHTVLSFGSPLTVHASDETMLPSLAEMACLVRTFPAAVWIWGI